MFRMSSNGVTGISVTTTECNCNSIFDNVEQLWSNFLPFVVLSGKLHYAGRCNNAIRTRVI